MSRSYRSASVGSRRNAGPFSFGFCSRPLTLMYSSTKPLRIGKVPVPSVA
jgi:hypothetical protein